MILSLFIFLFLISLIFIVFGLWRTEHTEFTLLGFSFLFILSTSMIGNNIEYKTGTNETYIYGTNFTNGHWDYSTGNPIDTQSPYLFHRDNIDILTSYPAPHLWIWMAIGSALSFIIVLVNLKRNNWGRGIE